MGQSYADIILGLAQLEASRANTAAANRRLDLEDSDKRRIQDRADAQIAKDEAKETARLASGAKSFGGLRSGVEAQLRQGLLTYDDAVSQLRGHGAKFELDPEEAVSNLTGLYSNELLPGRQAAGAAAAYKELLDRPITDDEAKNAKELFGTGYYKSVQDLKDSLVKSSAYQDKFQTSYLGNYFDTMYGKEERDTEGKRTGLRKVSKVDASFLPAYTAATEGKAGISLPKFDDGLLNPDQIQNREQSIRDTRKYLYSAGLTNLQGDIDNENQKLKNEGAKDIAKIGQGTELYKLMGLAFS